MRLLAVLPSLLILVTAALADGPADNRSDQVRRVPPPGVAIPDTARQELTAGAARLATELESLRGSLTNRPALAALLAAC